jgi:hypothetical protein
LQDPSDNIEIVNIASETACVTVDEIVPPGCFLIDIQCTGDPGFEFATFGINDLVASCEVDGEVPDAQCTFFNAKSTSVPAFFDWFFTFTSCCFRNYWTYSIQTEDVGFLE